MVDNRSKKQVGQYYLMEKVAQGGMAEIFKGLSYDVHGLKKTVCIKKILSHIAASEEFIDSLIDEAKIAVKMVHGNIAQTYDLGKVGDDYFMVMEYVEGKSLSQIHKRCVALGRLIPVPFLVYFISEVLSGLEYMHRRTDDEGRPLHIVHRDISPQNIMVSYSGTVKIIDFGIAKATFKVGSTDSGTLKGKFAYMSPEQAYGDAIDHRSDIFSLSIIFHEMLTGKRLFKAEDSRETIRNVRRAHVEPPSAFRGDLPEELDDIVMKGLAKDRRRRYSSAQEMRDTLIKFLHNTSPDFKPADVASFIQDLFKDEMGKPEPVEADAKTPHLIIDSTNSALADDSQFETTGAARAPIDMSEYMLEETTGAPSNTIAKPRAHGETKSISDLEVEEEGEGHIPFTKRLRIPRRPIIPIVFIIFAAAAIVITVAKIKTRPADMGGIAKPGEIMVMTTPADAAVFFDGRLAGQGSPVTIRDVTAGERHTVAATKDGFMPNEQQIRLKTGEILSVRLELKPSRPSHATLEIVSSPAGATVFLNDRETTFRTPATIENMEPEKEQKVGLYFTGYRFWERRVRLKGGETRVFDVELAKDFGSLAIVSEPTGSLVMIDGAPAGQTPFFREGLEPERIYRIELWHEGYVSHKREVRIAAGRKEELFITLDKEPTPAQEEFEARTKEEDKKDKGEASDDRKKDGQR